MARHVASAALLSLAVRPDLAVGGASCPEQTVQLNGMNVSISTGGNTAFRLRIGTPNIDNPMVDASIPDAACEVKKEKGVTTVTSSFGSLSVCKAGVVVLKDSSGLVLTTSKPISSNTKLELSTKGGKFFGRGASPLDHHELTTAEAKPKVYNRATYTPYYYSKNDGYGALGAVKVDRNSGSEMDLTWKTDFTTVAWEHGAGPFELYLIPAPTLLEGTKSYYDLLGKQLMLPLYAFGFGASRWGWKDKAYIADVLQKFRDGQYCIDYIICDFEWFATETDYAFDPAGKSTYHDFGYNPALLPSPKANLAAYDSDYQVKFAGIRKPRIGNSADLDFLRSKGWILPNGEPAGSYPPEGHYADMRSLDFAIPEMRDWYAKKMEHYTTDGVSFWWNDEGEANYYTFYYWNVAQVKAFHAKAPEGRFFSLNRAWSPGMGRLAAAVWTGDVSANWEDLKGTPGMLVNWVMGGAHYVGCDIGGFNGETTGPLLTRWLQVGAFMPVMRVHSVISVPAHFPWNFDDATQHAYRRALELRYRLVPYHYSLAHLLYKTSTPWIRPLVMEFPDDATVADISTEFMDGAILVAPVLREDGVREVTLPAGDWYKFAWEPESATCLLVKGGHQSFGGVAALHEVPAFVRPGSVVPLANIAKATRFLTDLPLEVQVYTGADGRFVLYEDDGSTSMYKNGQVRAVHLNWRDTERVFDWEVEANAGVKTFYKQLQLTVFDGATGSIIRSSVVDINGAGSMQIGQYGSIVM